MAMIFALTSCYKEDTQTTDDLSEDVIHSFDLTAENVTIQYLGKTISCQKIDGRLIFQGDIIVGNYTPNLRAAEFAENPSSNGDSIKLWTKGKVYYFIEYEAARKYILEAMTEITNKTNIKFVELKTPTAQNNVPSYIKFIEANGMASSWIGMKPFGQEIMVDNNWFQYAISSFTIKGAVIHELGHALGLMHEFSREDRDQYVKIDTANIMGYDNNKESIDFNLFAKYKMEKHSEFDFGSIMMYHPNAYSKDLNKKNEFLKRIDGSSYRDVYQNKQLSENDIEVLKRMYPNSAVSTTVVIDSYTSKLISNNIFRATGELICEGETAITERGILYGKEKGTPIRVAATENAETFTCDLVNLEPNTAYFAEAYVIQNGAMIVSENMILFKTSYDGLKENGVVINGVKWAIRNVDKPNTFAATPESAGMYYKWNNNVGWSTNPLINSNGSTVWDDTFYGGAKWFPENDPSPDGWRLPTLTEIQSLVDVNKVTNENATQNGIRGKKFTDKNTGAFLFLPAAGYINGGSWNNYDSWQGCYWTSMLDNGGVYSYQLSFYSPNASWGSGYNGYLFSVRSVAK